MQVEKILFDYVASVAGLPVAFPGVPFNPPADGRYLEVLHIPNDPTNYDWMDYSVTSRGLLQINIHWSRNVGIVAANDYARQLSESFKKSTVISNSIIVDAPPSIGSWVDDFVPFRISYRSI